MSSEQPKLNTSKDNNSTSGEPQQAAPQDQNVMASQSSSAATAPTSTTTEHDEADDSRAAGDVDFGQLLDQFEQEQATLEEGEVVRGTVVGLSERGVVIDFGYKSEGIVNPAEFTENGQLTVKAGDVYDSAGLAILLAGHEAVISAFNPGWKNPISTTIR